jgi:GAF domain-containing protein
MADEVLEMGAGERIEELERTLASLREDSEVAYVLLGLSGALAEVRSVEETLELTVRTVPELFGADSCMAAAWDPALRRFDVLAHSGFEPEVVPLLEKEAAEDGGFPFLHEALDDRLPFFISDEEPIGGRAAIVIPLVRWGEDFGGLQLNFSTPRTFGSKDIALARGVSRQVGVALNNARRFNLLKGLRDFGLRVGGGLRLQDVMKEVLRGATELLSGEGSWLYFLDSSRSGLVSSGSSSGTLALPERLARLDLSIEPWSRLTQGEAIVVPDLGVQFQGAGSAGHETVEGDLVAVATPLICGDEPVTAVLMTVLKQPRTPNAEELEALSVLAGQSAQAIENARRFDRQRSVARRLQAGLLSTDLPDMAGCEFGAIYEAADAEADVGGDFYDVIDLGDSRFGVVVGDVSGKGAEAAASTAMVKYTLRALAARNPVPSSVMWHLNNALAKDLPEDRFITLVYAVFEPASRSCSMSIAGHPAPLIYRAKDSSVEGIYSLGPIVGAFEDQNFEHVTVEIEPEDVFILHTDGLTEARNREELYGRERVEESLKRRARGSSAAEIARLLYEDARGFGRVTDDTVVFALKCGHV